MAFLSPSPIELMMIAVIALIVLGPNRLPEAARALGKGMREMRNSFQATGEEDDEGGEPRGPLPPGDEPEDDGVDDDASPGERHQRSEGDGGERRGPAARAAPESVGAVEPS